jgi:hypothetical protein
VVRICGTERLGAVTPDPPPDAPNTDPIELEEPVIPPLGAFPKLYIGISDLGLF